MGHRRKVITDRKGPKTACQEDVQSDGQQGQPTPCAASCFNGFADTHRVEPVLISVPNKSAFKSASGSPKAATILCLSSNARCSAAKSPTAMPRAAAKVKAAARGQNAVSSTPRDAHEFAAFRPDALKIVPVCAGSVLGSLARTRKAISSGPSS